MPIRIQNDLPARGLLEEENIFVMDENRAINQEIRPLKVGILNLMPLKEDTELQKKVNDALKELIADGSVQKMLRSHRA